jgi:membrane protease YdiL (CAAX protease family)
MRPGAADASRRRAVLAAPALVPATMALAFAALGRRLPPQAAYNAGFAVYWLGWCLGFPAWVLGPRRLLTVLRAGRSLTAGEAVLALLPAAGAVATELLPQRAGVDRRVAAVMVGSAVANATGEELLWRGVFADTFPADLLRGTLWPLAGFTLWHLAPQIVLPSRRGRAAFIAGAGAVGAVSALVTWRTGGVRGTLLPHALTDACGVTAARFRLGR